jgi:hypothetical protein
MYMPRIYKKKSALSRIRSMRNLPTTFRRVIATQGRIQDFLKGEGDIFLNRKFVLSEIGRGAKGPQGVYGTFRLTKTRTGLLKTFVKFDHWLS